jgi:hypothetical protein
MYLNIILVSNYYFRDTFPDMGRPKGLKYHRTIAVRVEEESAVVVEKMAQEEDRPIGVMARILLKEALAAREAKKGGKNPPDSPL